MSLRRLVVPALVLLPALVAGAGPAAAGGLAPGGSETITVLLPGAWATQADRLGVSVVDLVQSENECLAPERAAGDEACGADEGDLAGQLLAEVAAGTLVDGACHAAGTFVPLDLLTPGRQALLAGSGAGCLAVRLTFPDGRDDNVAQSDGIAFGVRTVAEGPGPGIPPVAGSSRAAGRPSTGVGAAGGAVGDRGPGTTGGQNGAGAPGGVPAPPGVGTGTAPPGTGRPGTVLGQRTTSVRVDGDVAAVQTKASLTSIGGWVFAWGSLFLAAVVLGLVFFLWWSRRRRREQP